MRILIAGVGCHNLRDLAAGPLLMERLRRRAWPSGVQVEDLSVGAVEVLLQLQQGPTYDAAVFVAAEPRGRPPGSIARAFWTMPTLTDEEIQARVADAIMGIVSLPTLLIVAGHFGALPPRVCIVEIEPSEYSWGLELSPLVTRALDEAESIVLHEVRDLTR